MGDKLEKGFRFFDWRRNKGIARVLYRTSLSLETIEKNIDFILKEIRKDMDSVKAEAVFSHSQQMFSLLTKQINDVFKETKELTIIQVREQEELKTFEDNLVRLTTKLMNFDATKKNNRLNSMCDKFIQDVAATKGLSVEFRYVAEKTRKKFYMASIGKDQYLSQFRSEGRLVGLLAIDSRKLMGDEISRESAFKDAEVVYKNLDGDIKTKEDIEYELNKEIMSLEKVKAAFEAEIKDIEKQYDDLFSIIIRILEKLNNFRDIVSQLEHEGYGQISKIEPEKKGWSWFSLKKADSWPKDRPPLETIKKWETETYDAVLNVIGLVARRLFVVTKKA